MTYKSIYTTLNESLAKPGYAFQFLGEAETCRSCPSLKPCLGRLEIEEFYFVTNVRKNKLECKLLEERAVVVQVKPQPRNLAVSSISAVVGTTISVQGVDGIPCRDNCLCLPNNVKIDKHYIVKRVIKKTCDCPVYASRSLVEVEPS
jgi:uncharacterized protein (UPF0179 family)